jgi:membrane-bound metal-dependent hydrolase YbcI (DUF457 family)
MATTYAPRQARTQRQAKQAEAAHLEGSSHAAIGFVAGIGLGLITTGAHHGDPALTHAIIRDGLFGFLTAGLSLLPDADHPDASFAHAGGPISHVVSHVISLLFGGHRQGFHSIPGTAVMCAVVASCSLWWPNRWALGGLALLLAICIAAGLRATRFIRHKFDAFMVGAAIAGLSVWVVRADLWWLCALGMALHIAADMRSGHGCALFWPFYGGRIGGDGRQPVDRERPVTKRPPAAPGPRPARTKRTPPAGLPVPVLEETGRHLGWQQGELCPACVTRDHGDCVDKGCQCTRGKHLARPGARTSRPPAGPDDGGPVPF